MNASPENEFWGAFFAFSIVYNAMVIICGLKIRSEIVNTCDGEVMIA
ncbi:MAG: hypothetical protein ACI8TA_002420 [Cyclobacteriaceae bacterium]|jgi:hypothetical protein